MSYPPTTPQRFVLVASDVCLAGDNRTRSVPAFQQCQGLWSYDNGNIDGTESPPSPPYVPARFVSLPYPKVRGRHAALRLFPFAFSTLHGAVKLVHGHAPVDFSCLFLRVFCVAHTDDVLHAADRFRCFRACFLVDALVQCRLSTHTMCRLP